MATRRDSNTHKRITEIFEMQIKADVETILDGLPDINDRDTREAISLFPLLPPVLRTPTIGRQRLTEKSSQLRPTVGANQRW